MDGRAIVVVRSQEREPAGVPEGSVSWMELRLCVCMHEELRMFSADFARGAAQVSLSVFILT